MKKTMVIAHRGASALVQFENTIEAFQKAIDLKVPMMEFDIRRTKDHKLISFHDDNIKGIKLSALTYEEINHMSKKLGFIVPTLEEILKLSKGKILLDIELKESGYEREIIALVTKYLDYSEYVMKSFIDESVIRIKQIDTKIITGLLLGIDTSKHIIRTRLSELFPVSRIRHTQVDFVSPNYRLINGIFLILMRLLKKPVYVWTVNDLQLMESLIKKKVDAIITDRPDLAMELMKK